MNSSRMYLDKAAVISAQEANYGEPLSPWSLCTVTQVEELKILIRMLPIWASGIVFSSLHAQVSTMFVQQGRAMNCNIGSFKIPPATLWVFDCITVLVWVPLYDRFNVPLAKLITRSDNGFTVLQRMGIGLVVSVLCIASAAIVEKVPQIFILGGAEVFYCVGQLKFFYGQSPESMRSLCCALGLLANAFGSYLSSLILTVVTYFTTKDGGDGWIADDLNGHLDYFFWMTNGSDLALCFSSIGTRVHSRRKVRNEACESMDSSDFSLDLTAEIEELRDAFAGMAPPPLGGDGFSPVGPLSVIGVEEVANWRRKFRLPDDVTIRIPGPFDKVSDFELGEILVYELIYAGSQEEDIWDFC
ncbi:PREDICTED: protein NRT1/ PTR FAMILY 8.3-like [Brassica oleracea var. oleracea]|uniref:protein NRT1/ PTR FAMILY 8.3-like n=1 Tax=Brassica oleracea var. oleracea TaxID=109376 RepID=UPI0006A7129C|nr:PREDICTED: protein NRT1/ PTR FAMILY 8.3-like [Brassica oleracea var. oleracea]